MVPGFKERIAREASLPWNLAKTLVQAAVFWTIFLLFIPWSLLRLQYSLRIPPVPCSACGIIGTLSFIFGSALALYSDYFMARYGQGTPFPFDTSRQLIVNGPYRYVRNPMAISGLMQLVGIGLSFGSVLVLLYVAVGFFVWNHFIRPWEEANLADRFGDEYARYRRSVRCWIPKRGARVSIPGRGT